MRLPLERPERGASPPPALVLSHGTRTQVSASRDDDPTTPGDDRATRDQEQFDRIVGAAPENTSVEDPWIHGEAALLDTEVAHVPASENGDYAVWPGDVEH